MKCEMCGIDFSIKYAKSECRNCSMFGGCKYVRCPFCGYENIPQKLEKKKNECGR